MPKNKEKRFEDVRVFPNVFEYPSFLNAAFPHKGAWNSNIFQNNRPITLELACGKGEYTIALAKAHPQKNFTGVDVKGNRLWVGAKTALSENLDNVRFLRIFIDHLDRYFSKDEISDIWITFPDPYLKSPKTKKRLTSPKFLSLYRKVCSKNCCINLKTDSDVLYNYTKSVIEEENLECLLDIPDVYSGQGVPAELCTVQTYYEKIHLKMGKTIRYLKFRLFPNS